MARSFTRIAFTQAILLLCLALALCIEATLPLLPRSPFVAKDALAKAKGIATGESDPNLKTFNVLDYGAKADCSANSAMSFIRAFKAACNCHDSAMMVIPKGEFMIGPVIFQGPCFNPTPLIISIEGTIKANPDLSEYAGGADGTEWITLQRIDGLIITGSGTLDGQGRDAWKNNDCATNDNCVRLPANIMFNRVTNVIIRGIKSIDPKGFHIFISNSQNFRIFDIHLLAPDDSPNTDGIHMSKSSVVKISRSNISTGDDCVSMIQGSSDISIKKVVCGPGHGFSIGSLGHYEDELDVSGITVVNCTMTNTDNGVRIKTYKACNPSKVSGVTFQDINMFGVKRPIIIDQEYGNEESSEPSKVEISDVKFINIKGSTVSKEAVTLLCSQSCPCKGIVLRDIDLEYIGPPKALPFIGNCTNVKPTFLGVQNPPPCNC